MLCQVNLKLEQAVTKVPLFYFTIVIEQLAEVL